MKKNAVFAAIFFSLCAGLPVFAAQWTFSAEQTFGARLGQCKEILWRKKSSSEDYYKLSELDYDILPALYLGANICAQTKNFEIKFLSKFFLPLKCGNLRDSDWLNDLAYGNGDTATKTDYSIHSLALKPTNAGLVGYDLELQAAGRFYPTNFLILSPVVSINAQYMSFRAKNGIGYYGNYNSITRTRESWSNILRRTIVDYEGKEIIDYEIYNFFLWTGIQASFMPADWITLSLASEVAALSCFFDFDHHITNDKFFFDVALSSFCAFRQSVKAEFKIKKFFSLCQTTTFMITGESHGSIYAKTSAEKKYKEISYTQAGSQTIYVDLELSAKFSW